MSVKARVFGFNKNNITVVEVSLTFETISDYIASKVDQSTSVLINVIKDDHPKIANMISRVHVVISS